MPIRPAHGQASKGRLTVSETQPAIRLSAATPKAPRGITGQRNKARRKLQALATGGSPEAVEAIELGRDYTQNRVDELHWLHGGDISSGVCAMVESAGELLSGARYWFARGMATDNLDMVRLAAQLMQGHRAAERDAWEIAAREADARRAVERVSRPVNRLAEALAPPGGLDESLVDTEQAEPEQL